MSKHSTISKAGLLITLGIIFGDIGTSPLYTFQAILKTGKFNEDLILGGLSCVFWTLTLQTSLKYILVVLSADNKGEGGIFSLFNLIKRKAKWALTLALIGGCALLADGVITPAITVSSAVEGLQILHPQIDTIPIVLVILLLLFTFQQMGTNIIGKAFGPIMILWFVALGSLGAYNLSTDFTVLRALNPYYAVHIIQTHPHFLAVLGAVFLCTTGAEALYSDMGHCGRKNIRVSWILVKICLLLNYFGQGAYLLHETGQGFEGNPFYAMIPRSLLIPMVILATIAAVIASQAMITGAYTLISEAVKLNVWPKVKINYPSNEKGLLYVPGINWLLFLGSSLMVLIFKESSNMEQAYGLTIIMSMLITTILMTVFLFNRGVSKPLVVLFFIVYISLESVFFLANIQKFADGGWTTFVIGISMFSVMWAWSKARSIKKRYEKLIDIGPHLETITALSADTTISKYATNLVYLTSANSVNKIEDKVIYSIIHKQPKRADIYWILHVEVADVPYLKEFKVTTLVPEKVMRIDFKLGFREEQRISILFRLVVEELVKNKEIDITSRYPSLAQFKIASDFRFIIFKVIFSNPWMLNFFDRFIVYYYLFLKRISLSEEKGFGLDSSSVSIEKVPIVIPSTQGVKLRRVQS